MDDRQLGFPCGLDSGKYEIVHHPLLPLHVALDEVNVPYIHEHHRSLFDGQGHLDLAADERRFAAGDACYRAVLVVANLQPELGHVFSISSCAFGPERGLLYTPTATRLRTLRISSVRWMVEAAM